jgi:hypothetical protein
MTPRRLAARAAAYAWAAPWSVLGLLLGAFMAMRGGRMRIRQGVLEIAGGNLDTEGSQPRTPFGVSAITFGHVVLAVNDTELTAVRAHEQVHVRQYERWGPLFVPAYVVSSIVQLARRRDPYLDNCFEREAYAMAPRQAPPQAPMARDDR